MVIFRVLSGSKRKIKQLLEVHVIVMMYCVVMFESTMFFAQDGCLEPRICLGNAAVHVFQLCPCECISAPHVCFWMSFI